MIALEILLRIMEKILLRRMAIEVQLATIAIDALYEKAMARSEANS